MARFHLAIAMVTILASVAAGIAAADASAHDPGMSGSPSLVLVRTIQ